MRYGEGIVDDGDAEHAHFLTGRRPTVEEASGDIREVVQRDLIARPIHPHVVRQIRQGSFERPRVLGLHRVALVRKLAWVDAYNKKKVLSFL